MLVVVASCVAIAVAISRTRQVASNDLAGPSGRAPATRAPGATGPAASRPNGTVVSGDLAVGNVAVVGTRLPTLDRGSDAAVGERAPVLHGASFDGSEMTIGGDGRPKVIVLLAHWCPHCRAEVPRIQDEIDAAGLPADVDVVAVATSIAEDRDNYPPADWLRREHWTVPTMVDDGANTAARAYGLSAFPFFVVVDAEGRVVERRSGELSPGDFDQMLADARR